MSGKDQTTPVTPVTPVTPAAERPMRNSRTPRGGRNRSVFGRFVFGLLILGVLFGLRNQWWPFTCRFFSRQAYVQRDFAKSLKWLDAVRLIASDDSSTALMRARIYRKQGKMVELAAALKEAHRIDAPVNLLDREQWLALAQSGQMSQAEQHLSKLLQEPGEDLEEICDAYVTGYMRNLNFGAAHTLLESWIKDFPESAWPHLLRGRISMVTDDFRTAESSFRKACELVPDDPEFRLELARSLVALNSPEEAIRLLKSIDEDSRHRSAVALELALCLRMTGETKTAVNLLEEVVRKSPQDSKALLELGRTYLEIGDFVKAENILQQALAASASDDEVHYVLAKSLQEAGKADAARPHFQFSEDARKAKKDLGNLRERVYRNPLDLDAKIKMGEIMLKYGEPDEGVIRLLAALEIDPDNQQVQTLLSDYYQQRADSDPAFAGIALQFQQKLKTRSIDPAESSDSAGSRESDLESRTKN